jgi:ureidoglycolate lyase
MKIIAEPLTEKAVAPYGDVLAAPAEFGRAYFDEGLRTSRSTAWPSLSVSHVRPLPSLPLEAKVMERHEFSSQSFLPLDVSRWIVVVAPSGADGGPDPSRAVAFLVGPGPGVTYHANTWHHPLTILDRPARFAVVMWRDGTRTDEEFRTLAAPFTVELPGG